MSFDRIIEWSFVISILLFLLYAALAIGQEKEASDENAKDYELSSYLFYTPSWWKIKEKTKNALSFIHPQGQRDWRIQISLFENQKNQSAKEIAFHFLKEHQVVLDESALILEDEDLFFTQTKTRERAKSFIRIESTATVDIETRVYLILFVYTDLLSDDHLFIYSQTGVLSGGVEGPYVDELLKNLEICDDEVIREHMNSSYSQRKEDFSHEQTVRR